MSQISKNSSNGLTTNDVHLTPSLNSLLLLSSSKGHLNRGKLQRYDGEIILGQRKHDPVSNSDNSDMEEEVVSPRISNVSSITIQDNILSPKLSDDSTFAIYPRTDHNQSDRPCTHILLQKNEILEDESGSFFDSEVNGCVCRSEKANQNYIVQIKSEPTTIVITRRGSTNSVTAVGSCARFRAGGSDKEKGRRGKKVKTVAEEDSKAPVTVWERRDSDGRLSSTSGESIGARSTTDTALKRSPKRNKENYFKRLSSRFSESTKGRKASRSSRASSPRHKRDMTDEELKTRMSKAFVPKDPMFFGRGRKHAYEGGREGQENANKSEGSNKREGRSKSFFTKSKPKRTPSTSRSRSGTRSSRSKSKSQSPRPKRVPSKTGRRPPKDTPSEPFYIQQPLTPTISYQSISQKPSETFAEDSYPKRAYGAGNQHQYSQTDPYSSPYEISNKPGPLCCTCGMPISEKRDTFTETVTEEPEKPEHHEHPHHEHPHHEHPHHEHPHVTHQPESKPHRKMILNVRSDVRSTVAYDAVVELDGSEMPGLESYPHYVAHRGQPASRAPSFEQPVTEEPAYRQAPKGPHYQHAASQCSGPIYDHPPDDHYAHTPHQGSATHLPHSSPVARSHQPSITDHAADSGEVIAKHPVEPEEDTHVPKAPSYHHHHNGPTTDHSPADHHHHGHDQDPGRTDHARGHDETYTHTPQRHKPESSGHRRDDTINVYCRHCGCGLQTVSSDLLKDPSRPPPKDDNVSHVLWVLAKITVFKDGTRNFEILESTSIPPGHYLMPGNEEFMIVTGNR